MSITQQSLVNNVADELLLQDDEGVQVAHLVQTLQECAPGRLKHLDEDIVVDVADEVGHLVVRQVEPVELGLEAGAEPPKLLLVAHSDAPGGSEHVLNLLQFEHEGENLVIIAHDFLSENG